MASLQGELIDFVLAGYKADPEVMQNLIAQAEGGFKPVLLSIVQHLQLPPPYSLIMPFVDAESEAFVDSLIAKYSPAELYALIGDFLAQEAKNLGG